LSSEKKEKLSHCMSSLDLTSEELKIQESQEIAPEFRVILHKKSTITKVHRDQSTESDGWG
jgi:hypothetical protein